MSFTPILIPQDFANKGAMSLPNQPVMPAEDLKRAFDSPSREVCAPAVNRLITELEDPTASQSLGATAPAGRGSATTVQGVINKLSEDLATLETSTAPAIEDAHTHTNKDVLDGISEDPTTHEFLYNGDSVGKTSYDQLSNLPQINGVTLTGNKSSSDIGINIPANLSDLTADSDHRTVTDTEKSTWNGKSVVSYTQTYTQAGQKIGEITIDGVTTDLKAPSGGGGGGGGAVDSVNGQTGTVTIGVGELDGVTLASVGDRDALVYNSGWKNIRLPLSALTGSYDDLSNKPGNATTSSDGFMSSTDKTKLDGVASGAEVNVQSDWEQSDSSADDYIKNKPSVLGHEMIPTTNDISTVALLDDGDDNYVVNAYTVQRYSNVECMTIFTTAAQGTDTIGSWNDTWETDGDRQNWLWHSALYDILNDDEVEASMVFDVQTNETVSVYAYRVDDEVYIEATNTTGKNPKAEGWYESDGQTPPTYTETNDTTVQSGKTYYMAGGAIAIKLNSKIQTAGGVKIGLNLKRQRTLVELFREIS